MRNLLVITSGFPQKGTNRYISNFVKEFTDIVSDNFNEIYVISPQAYFPKFLRRFKIFEKFYRYTNFYDYKYDNIKVFYPKYFAIPFITRKHNYKQRRKKIEQTIKNNNLIFDIIHCHFIGNGSIGIDLSENLNNVKVVVHCHDSSLKNDLNNNPLKYINIFKKADFTISFCEHYDIINNFLKSNDLENKNVYIPNFVNTDKFYPQNNIDKLRSKYGFKADDKILICIGNIIYEHKGQNDILKIWKDLDKKINNLHLILIGDGPDKEKMLSTIKKLNTDKIHYLGPKSNQEIIDYLNISDLFLFPSRHESFGIAPIEAISCGIPIISYKNGGTEYIIKDNNIGTILQEQNIKLLEEGIINMLNKQYDKHYLHKYITDRYSQKIIREKLIDLYKNLSN